MQNLIRSVFISYGSVFVAYDCSPAIGGLGNQDVQLYMACPPQILVQDRGLMSALCPGRLGHAVRSRACWELGHVPGASGWQALQYLAWVAAGLS